MSELPWDPYNRRARLQPSLLVILPVGLVLSLFDLGGDSASGPTVGVIATLGGTALFTQLGRDLGKRREPKLFGIWGGAPTTIRLRHRSAENPAQLERVHRRLGELMPDLEIPDSVEEARDPASADLVYESAVERLIARTRDRTRFRLVFEENCNYGFRRNLWGMKPLGVGLAVVGAVIAVVGAMGTLGDSVDSTVAGFSLAACVALVGVWTIWITPSWVRLAADAYADRLLEAVETL